MQKNGRCSNISYKTLLRRSNNIRYKTLIFNNRRKNRKSQNVVYTWSKFKMMTGDGIIFQYSTKWDSAPGPNEIWPLAQLRFSPWLKWDSAPGWNEIWPLAQMRFGPWPKWDLTSGPNDIWPFKWDKATSPLDPGPIWDKLAQMRFSWLHPPPIILEGLEI